LYIEADIDERGGALTAKNKNDLLGPGKQMQGQGNQGAQ